MHQGPALAHVIQQRSHVCALQSGVCNNQTQPPEHTSWQGHTIISRVLLMAWTMNDVAERNQ